MTNYQVPVLSKHVWQAPVLDKDLTAPPGGESKGDRYIVGSGASGDWSGQDGNIAQYNGSGWDFTAKKEGMFCYIMDENKLYWYVSSWRLYGGRHLRFTIIDPASAYDIDSEICIVPKTPAALTITNLEVTCDADPATEVQGDLKCADDFISLANAAVINDFDTTNGARSDSSISSGSVAAGKCIYVSFDSKPDTNIKQISFDVSYDPD